MKLVCNVASGFLPAQKGAGQGGAIIINLHIVICTVGVQLQVEGCEGETDEVARFNSDEPGAVGSVRVVSGMTRAGERSCWFCECLSTTCKNEHKVSKVTLQISIDFKTLYTAYI